MQPSDLTKGNIFRTLVHFSLPFIASTLLQTMYGMVDMMIVGNFVGRDGLSAVSIGTQLMNLITLFCVGFSTAGQILVAQKTGAQDGENVKKINGTLCTLIFLLSIFLTLVGLLGCRTFLVWLSTPKEAFAYAVSYVTICSAGVIFTGFYNMFSAVFRGMGDSTHPLVFVAVAAGLKVLLYLIFVGVFHFSVSGAALATVLGQAVSVLCSVCFLWRHQQVYHFGFHPRDFRIDRKAALALLKLGFPIAIQQSAISLSFLFVSKMINQLGVIVSATFGAGQKIRDIPNIVTQGIGLAGASIVGQNIGAGEIDRVRQAVFSAMKITMSVCVIYGILTFLFPEFFFRLFSDDSQVLSYAELYILTMLLDLPARGVMSACRALVNGVGAARFGMIVGFSDAFLGRILFTYLLGDVLGLGV